LFGRAVKCAKCSPNWTASINKTARERCQAEKLDKAEPVVPPVVLGVPPQIAAINQKLLKFCGKCRQLKMSVG